MIILENLLPEAIKTLYKNNWVSLLSTPDELGNPYIYAHEVRCNGIVAVLPYKRSGKDNWLYGVRQENVPAWGKEQHLSSLTGGVDKGETPEVAAIRELQEESGFKCDKSDLKSLGTCRGTKATDVTYHLFAVDVAKLPEDAPTGDDTGEDRGKIIWMHSGDVNKKVICPVFYVMMSRLGFG